MGLFGPNFNTFFMRTSTADWLAALHFEQKFAMSCHCRPLPWNHTCTHICTCPRRESKRGGPQVKVSFLMPKRDYEVQWTALTHTFRDWGTPGNFKQNMGTKCEPGIESRHHFWVLRWQVAPRKTWTLESYQMKKYRRGWLLWIMDGRANPLMDRKVVGVVFFGVVAVATSPQLLGVVWCSAVVVVVVA